MASAAVAVPAAPGGVAARRPARRPHLSAPVVAVVGATGAVGVEMVKCLEKRRFPLAALRLFASARSAGQTMSFAGRSVLVEELREDALDGIDIALFSAGSAISKRFGPRLAERGTIVIDNSSAFRMQADVPLVVPEINPQALAGHRNLIANPNCAAILGITPLWPIHRVNPIKRLILSTYQAASGAGAAAMEELREATRAHLDNREYRQTVLPHPYAFNVFSHNTRIDPVTGYNEEETKVMQETRKIFGEPDLRVTATCVRVPVLRAHCIAVNFECERPITAAEVREIVEPGAGREAGRRPRAQLLSDAEGRDRSRRAAGRPHPAGPQRSIGPLGGVVRGGRPVAQGCGAQRGADRGGVAGHGLSACGAGGPYRAQGAMRFVRCALGVTPGSLTARWARRGASRLRAAGVAPRRPRVFTAGPCSVVDGTCACEQRAFVSLLLCPGAARWPGGAPLPPRCARHPASRPARRACG